MLEFRITFMGHRGNVRGAQHFPAKDDAAAIRVAEGLNVASIGNDYELWQNGRRVTVPYRK